MSTHVRSFIFQAVLNKLPEPPEAGAISSAVTRLENLGALEDGVGTQALRL